MVSQVSKQNIYKLANLPGYKPKICDLNDKIIFAVQLFRRSTLKRKLEFLYTKR